MGVKQWLFQRASNAAFILFGIWLLLNINSGNGVTSAIATAEGTSLLFLAAILVLAGLNSILAGWQIAGDYAQKVGVSAGLITGLVAIASVVMTIVGLGVLF